MAFTLSDVQAEIALDYDASNTPPATTTIEWQRRTKLINRFERIWAKELDYKWRELFKSAQLTFAAGSNSAALPAGFTMDNVASNTSGHIRVDSAYYKIIHAEQAKDYDSSSMVAYVTGSDAEGYTLNLKGPTSSQRIVYLDYYTTNLATDTAGTSEKAVLVEGTDKTKCPNPYYLVYGTLAVLYKADDDEIGRAQDYERMAFECMSQMIGNRIAGNLNQDNVIPDDAELNGYPNIGE